MQYLHFLLAIIFSIIFIFGCTAESSSNPPPPSGPIGGGCGVTAPADSADAAVIDRVSETAEKRPPL